MAKNYSFVKMLERQEYKSKIQDLNLENTEKERDFTFNRMIKKYEDRYNKEKKYHARRDKKNVEEFKKQKEKFNKFLDPNLNPFNYAIGVLRQRRDEMLKQYELINSISSEDDLYDRIEIESKLTSIELSLNALINVREK